MKNIFTLTIVVLITIGAFAQAPQKMSYQCVIRNASGVLVTNQSVGIRISVLQGTTSGTMVYQETYNPNPQTNANGLVTVEIGGGTSISGIFSNINWASGHYFLKTETDPTGGTNYTIVGTSQLLSVPYAQYAKTAGNGFSGNYNDLSNIPSLALVATSGSYNDLTNKPTLFNGSWANITGKPTTLAGYGITDGMNNSHVANGITSTLISNWNTAFGWGNHVSAGYAVYPSLTGNDGKFLKTNGTSVSWGPLAAVASSGSYDDLLDKPTSPGLMPSGNNSGDILYWNGTGWILLPIGGMGQILMVNSSGKPIWVNISGAPTASTLPVTNINGGLATLNCNVNPNGLPTSVVFEYGTTTSYGSTIALSPSTVIGNSTVTLSSNLTSLTVGTIYHFRVKAVNTFGTTYGEDMFFTPYYTSGSIAIGQFYAGGVIFYIDGSGQHGLVCSPTNQSQGVQWYNGIYIITNATDKIVGTGLLNTNKIVAAQGPGIYAASLCDQLELNGFNDWFLPSIEELKLMFLNRAIIGGFNMSSYYWWYWSSTEKDLQWAHMWDFSRDNPNMDGEAGATKNGVGAGVRAIRAF